MYVVIGATGFIGFYTVEELLGAGHEVLACGRNGQLGQLLEQRGAQFHKLDVTNKDDFDALPEQGVEGVVLLAGLLPANATADLKEHENAVVLLDYTLFDFADEEQLLIVAER